MITKALFLISLVLLTSCMSSKKEEPKVVYAVCTAALESQGTCTRYMDRKIYFAANIFDEPYTNNPFDVERVQDILREISSNTNLGDNYFEFYTTDKNSLNLILEAQTVPGGFKSFIQILPDIEFNEIYATVNSPDPNAILEVNQANKKQFYLILRESCFRSNNVNCTNSVGQSFTSNKGLKALVARSFGRMIGLRTTNCGTKYDHPMCATEPNDDQWSITEEIRMYDLFNNALETITNSPTFYEVYFEE